MVKFGSGVFGSVDKTKNKREYLDEKSWEWPSERESHCRRASLVQVQDIVVTASARRSGPLLLTCLNGCGHLRGVQLELNCIRSRSNTRLQCAESCVEAWFFMYKNCSEICAQQFRNDEEK